MPTPLANIILVVIGGAALWSAFDYISDSVRIFRANLRRYQKRNID